MKEYISKSAKKIQGSGIRRFFDLIAKMQNPINLSIGEPDFGFISEVAEALKEAINENSCRYTNSWGIPALREAIAEKYNNKFFYSTDAKQNREAQTVKKENILITAGASGALDLLFRAILDPEDEIIIFDPYFIMYENLPKLLEAKPVVVATDNNFLPNINKLRKAITDKTKAIIVNSPNNPTGIVYPEEIINKIVAIAEENNLLLVSDEVYEDFTYEKENFSPYGIYNKTIVVNSFSKNLALTGQRIGFVIGQRELLEEMAKIQQYSYVCAPHLSQTAALKNINLDISKYVELYKKKRDLVINSLKNDFKIVKPGGAFYVFLKVGNAEKFVEKCLEKNLIVLPGNIFSASDDHIRISYAASDEDLIKGIEILKEVKNELSRD